MKAIALLMQSATLIAAMQIGYRLAGPITPETVCIVTILALIVATASTTTYYVIKLEDR